MTVLYTYILIFTSSRLWANGFKLSLNGFIIDHCLYLETSTLLHYYAISIILYIFQGLFDRIAACPDDNVTHRIDISYFEIYNERVRDLLQPDLLKNNENYSLKIREHPKEGPYVKGETFFCVGVNSIFLLFLSYIPLGSWPK